MYKKIVKQIERQIVENISHKEFLKQVGFHKKDAQNLVKKHVSTGAISDVIMGDDFSGSRIFKLCFSLMEELCPVEPAEGWLQYSYNLARKDMFEESVDIDSRPEAITAARFYLEVLAAFLSQLPAMGKVETGYWFDFATEEEISGESSAAEYRTFLVSFRRDKIYEMMWIGREVVNFDLLGHVGGVHHIAMHAARQLKTLGVPVELGLISGAAAGHDIGKYGCHGEEVRRIPYLHYYYTAQWFKRHKAANIGHIAANHSTWDLELENLSVENLLLIYADFRVKSVGRDEQGKEIITYFSLKDAFDVILSKLDNVDQAKENRYRKVYAKLKDFEDYMLHLGVDTDLNAKEPKSVTHADPAILSAEDTVQLLKYMAVDHNIRLMHLLQSDVSLGTVQEAARSEKNWKNSRAYISVFEEYFTYMTRRQKALTLNFLYEHMMHKEGDVRRQAAALMGEIIVNFDDDYRKEIPKSAIHEPESAGLKLWEKYLAMMFTPDHKIIEKHRRWLGFALKIVVETVLSQCKPQDRTAYLKKLLAHYQPGDYDDVTAFMLLDTMMVIPLQELDEEERTALLNFASGLYERSSMEIRAGVLRFLQKFMEITEPTELQWKTICSVIDSIRTDDDVALIYVKEQLQNRGASSGFWHSSNTQDVVTDIFLKNMKIATPWIIKEINIQMLLDYVKENPEANVLQVAAHLSNLLKVSERITVRHTAGRALLETAPLLSKDQRNEIAIELNMGLETGEYEFSKYIPEYLGKFVLWLHPLELDEFLRDLKKFLISVNDQVVCVALDTLGVMLKHYGEYRSRFETEESKEAYEERAKQMIGLLLGGLANYNESVSQEAFLVIGQVLFSAPMLSEKEKLALFRLTYKKIVTTIPGQEKDQLALFNNAASLNQIYRFINDYLFEHGKFQIAEPAKVAFFPGTFDPFSLSHKGIATALRDMGFMVYLALDEFSWSKKTQPRMIRKQIMEMTVANEENIFIFPDDLPVNIANPDNLRKLHELFPGKELYLAVGADVVKNASSYKAEPQPWSVQTMNHVIFQRFGVEMDYESIISGKVSVLELPENLMDISSTRIRDNVDRNRDISNLVDPVVQNYIYENNLYLREPEFKPVLQNRSVRLEVRKRCTAEVIRLLMEHIPQHYDEAKALEDSLQRSGAVLLWDSREGERLLGAAVFRGLTTSELYEEFKNTAVVEYIRNHTSGKIVLIQGLYRFGKTDVKERGQLMLTEAIAHALSRDFTYCVFSPKYHLADAATVELLERQGFVALEEAAAGRPVFAVDMKQPLVVFKNIATSLKAPFNEAPRVIAAIDKAHHRLQKAMTRFYPGNLVLSFHASVMHGRMVELITKANGVPAEPLPVRQLGKDMCVPFGKILRGVAIPNTVTKTLHTERVMTTDLKNFVITKYPNYSPLPNQIRTIRAFNRDVILVDDILHKGHRMKALDPLFKAEGLPVDRLVVGVLSGTGKDLMAIQKRKVESVYYLPNLKAWFVESSIYPFIGGDTVDRPVKMRANLLNSANMILPYATPWYVSDAPKDAVYHYSMTCLENARDLLEALEREYQDRYERKLTLNRLSEVVISPCRTDWGDCLDYDYHLAPSAYVKDDLERLVRLEGLLK